MKLVTYPNSLILICLTIILYDNVEAMEFKWRIRISTVKGIAFALSYLQHECTAPIVHRDVSSSNILLNFERQASVSDFGTARLLQYDSSNRTIVAGTIGYIAPGKLLIDIFSFFFYFYFSVVYNGQHAYSSIIHKNNIFLRYYFKLSS